MDTKECQIFHNTFKKVVANEITPKRRIDTRRWLWCGSAFAQ